MKRYCLLSKAVALVLIVCISILVATSTTPDNVPGTLSSFYSEAQYQIYEENGEVYMRSKKYLNAYLPNSVYEGGDWRYHMFASVEEMQNAILSGHAGVSLAFAFPTEDLDTDPETKTVKICDLRKIYDAVLPNDAEVSYLYFYGNTYEFHISAQPARITMCTSGDLSGYVEEFWFTYNNPQASYNDEYKEVISVRDISDRNAREILVKNPQTKTQVKYLFYTVQGWRGEVYVAEYYNEAGELSTISLVGEDQGADFMCEITCLKERPSEAYLASFGLNFRLDLWKPFAY